MEFTPSNIYNISLVMMFISLKGVLFIIKNKHMSYDDRLEIEKGLKEKLSFKQIGENIYKDCTTISKEIRNHFIVKNIDGQGRPFNDCIHRKNCEFREKGKLCNIHTCSHYLKEECQVQIVK